MMKKLLLLCLVFFISACATVEPPKVLIQKEVILFEPNPAFLEPCVKPKPPAVDTFMMASMRMREDLLARLVLDQYKSIAVCNIQLATQREQLQKERDLVKKHNEDEALRMQSHKER